MGSYESVIEKFSGLPGGLLPALHAIQAQYGCIPPDSVPVLAQYFHLSRAEVHGVITFYPHFRQEPPGRHTLQLCQAEACVSMGAVALAEHVCARLGGVSLGATTRDGGITLESVSCLGLCAQSPAIMVDGVPHARVTPERFDTVLEMLGAGPSEARGGGA